MMYFLSFELLISVFIRSRVNTMLVTRPGHNRIYRRRIGEKITNTFHRQKTVMTNIFFIFTFCTIDRGPGRVYTGYTGGV